MWDLNTIIRENNRVALDTMMRPPALELAQSPQPAAWSLSALAKKMRIGPPLLQELLKCFTSIDDINAFVNLIRDYLPEHENDILMEPREGRVYKFCYLFNKRYFPLPTWSHEANLSQFVVGMPVELMGMSYSAYHDLDIRPGYALLLSLVVYPYEGDERDLENDDVPFDPFNPMHRFALETKLEEIADVKDKKPEWRPKKSDIIWVKNLMATLDYGGKWMAPMGFIFIKIDDRNIELRQAENTPEVRETVHRTMLIAEKAGLKVKVHIGKTAVEKVLIGGRVPLLDLIQRNVGEDLARRIPAEGWEPKVLHSMTDGTPYDGVGHFADWACSQTGCIVLDSNYGDCDYVDGTEAPVFEWSRFNVEALAKEYSKVQEIRHKIGHMVEWLEADPRGRFQELVDFLMSLPASQRKTANPKKKRSSYDPTEHWCPLDQIHDTEEEEDGNEQAAGREAVGAGVQVREITPEEFIDGIDPEDY